MRAAGAPGWHGRLRLDYRRDGDGTTALDRHDGPLRVLRRLYPEGPAVCHHVLVHPPGGIVGGDVLEIEATLAPGSHALVTTPGATRFYRSTGATASQRVVARVAAGARLEWLPLETIAFSGCQAENSARFELEPGAETIGWDLTALGLPASNRPFERGRFSQRIEFPGRWLERGVVDAADTRLLDSPLGWAGHRVLATLWFATGGTLDPSRRDALLVIARAAIAADPLRATAGATSTHEGIVVLRALSPNVEPAMRLATRVWAGWRRCAWGLDAVPPRVWRT